MNKHNIKLKSIISEQNLEVLSHLNENHLTSEDLIIFLNSHFNISSSIDLKTITNYKQDSSNMAGTANGLLKPKDDKECAIILYACKKNNTTITISAGRTSLNGGATPNGGIIISIEKMILPEGVYRRSIALYYYTVPTREREIKKILFPEDEKFVHEVTRD